MKSLEFLSIMLFLIGGSAGEESIGTAILLMFIAGGLLVFSAVLPERRKRK